MTNFGMDPEALTQRFSDAAAQQGEALRKAVNEATLKALQGRELTVQNIRQALEAITQAVTQASAGGAGTNAAAPFNVEALFRQAFDGMDAALRQAVEAQRKALEAIVEQGVGLQETQMKAALANVEKMEESFFAAVTSAAERAGAAAQGPWEHVLKAMKLNGTATGAQATSAIQQLMSQTQTGLRASRENGMRAAQALMDSYAAVAGGVLLGMSQALAPAGAAGATGGTGGGSGSSADGSSGSDAPAGHR